MTIEATKFYVRHREGYPELEMQDVARRGFLAMGVEVAPYEWGDDVFERMDDLGPTVGIAGYIGDVWKALDRLGVPHPEPVDYPEELRPFLGRSIHQATLGEVTRSVARVFVKPVQHKFFTGFVWDNTRTSRMRIVTVPPETPVWVSDVVEFAAEFRCFVLDGEVLDVRRYNGDWWRTPDPEVVGSAVDATYRSSRALALDFGVTRDGRTLLVEKNDGFALGTYGLGHTHYARMLSARWHELTKEA